MVTRRSQTQDDLLYLLGKVDEEDLTGRLR